MEKCSVKTRPFATSRNAGDPCTHRPTRVVTVSDRGLVYDRLMCTRHANLAAAGDFGVMFGREFVSMRPTS